MVFIKMEVDEWLIQQFRRNGMILFLYFSRSRAVRLREKAYRRLSLIT
jgi:hypothetical protein